MTTQLISDPEFRRLWLVGFISFVVRWLEMLAVGVFAYQITESAFVVANLTMLRLLPMGLFGAFLGVVADRVERRSALIVTIIVSMASTLALAVLASLGAIKVWHLAAAAFVNGTCWATDNPVRRMMMGDVAGPDRMSAAMSLDVATNNLSRVAGPMLSGILLAKLGIAAVFWVGAALTAASLVSACRIRLRHRPSTAHAPPFITSVREGISCVLADERLIGAFMITIIFNIFGWPFTSMIPVIAKDYLQLGPDGVGLLASCEGIGGLIGALFFARVAHPQWFGKVYVGAVALYLVMVVGFATSPVALVAGVVLLLNGIGVVGFSVMQATLVYRNSPVHMRARLLGVLSVCIGTGPIGFVYLGFLAEALTPRVGTVALAAQGMLALLLTRRYWGTLLRS